MLVPQNFHNQVYPMKFILAFWRYPAEFIKTVIYLIVFSIWGYLTYYFLNTHPEQWFWGLGNHIDEMKHYIPAAQSWENLSPRYREQMVPVSGLYLLATIICTMARILTLPQFIKVQIKQTNHYFSLNMINKNIPSSRILMLVWLFLFSLTTYDMYSDQINISEPLHTLSDLKDYGWHNQVRNFNQWGGNYAYHFFQLMSWMSCISFVSYSFVYYLIAKNRGL